VEFFVVGQRYSSDDAIPSFPQAMNGDLGIYTQFVAVFTIFLSTFMALGLQKILDHLPQQRWPCFFIALTLFLRFLAGSANQMWRENVLVVPIRDRRFNIMWDFCWLAVFASIALGICYSANVEAFLVWCIGFGVAATMAAIIDTARQHRRAQRARDWVGGWFLINLIFSVAAALCYAWYSKLGGDKVALLDVSVPVGVLVLVSCGLLIADLCHQINVLYPKP
jgi:hypothetical protein